MYGDIDDYIPKKVVVSMREFFDFLGRHPFITGLLIGFIIALAIWLRGLLQQRSLRREIASLKESLYTKLQIETKGHMTRENELEELKRQNENLRLTVGTLQQKPGRSEIRQLHVYDKAVHSMLARAPGFAPTWEMVVREAEEEVRQTETGITAFFRKVFIPQTSLPKTGNDAKLIDHEGKKDE